MANGGMGLWRGSGKSQPQLSPVRWAVHQELRTLSGSHQMLHQLLLFDKIKTYINICFKILEPNVFVSVTWLFFCIEGKVVLSQLLEFL
jgi:hypothetical protein